MMPKGAKHERSLYERTVSSVIVDGIHFNEREGRVLSHMGFKTDRSPTFKRYAPVFAFFIFDLILFFGFLVTLDRRSRLVDKWLKDAYFDPVIDLLTVMDLRMRGTA